MMELITVIPSELSVIQKCETKEQKAVMVASKSAKTRKPSKLEGIKENSNFLREPLASELLEDTTHFSKDAMQKITVFFNSF
jgi:sulfite reductase (ferredoxin)